MENSGRFEIKFQYTGKKYSHWKNKFVTECKTYDKNKFKIPNFVNEFAESN